MANQSNGRPRPGGSARRSNPPVVANAGTTGNPYDDAALARALQEEYEREYRRRSMQQHLGNGNATAPAMTTAPVPARASSARASPVAPSASSNSSRSLSTASRGALATRSSRPEPSAPNEFFDDSEPFYAPNEVPLPPATAAATRNNDLNFVLSGDSFGSVEVSDAAYARQLEREMRREDEEQRLREIRKQHLQQQRDSYRATRSVSTTSGTSSQSPNLVGLSRSSTPNSLSSHSNVSMLNPPRNTSRAAAVGTTPFAQPREMAPPIVAASTRSQLPPARPIESRSSNNNSRNQYSSSRPVREESLYPVETGAHGGYSDEEYARRLEQELRDEEVARQAFAEEQIRQSAMASQAMYSNQGHNARAAAAARPKRGCCYGVRRCLSCMVTLILSVILAALLYVFVFGQDGGNPLSWDPDQFREEDPFNAANKEDANLWKTRGGVGLELVLINALDTNWHDAFYLAVQQWDAGSPDALTLQIEEASPEAGCTPETGKLKVCNGNYGETNWRGINKVLLENGWIYSSAARMNEFYSADGDIEQKQYTMCHEMGHGFGLPHTDENFFNKDLNNCMDYTNNPKNNMQPSEPNFLFLSRLYGTVDGSPVPPEEGTGQNSTSSVTASAEDPQGASGKTEDEGEGGGGWTDIFGNLGNRRHRSLERMSDSQLPPSVALALAEVDLMIENGALFDNSDQTTNEQKGWRRLHQTIHGEEHEVDLGMGFTVRIHVLR